MSNFENGYPIYPPVAAHTPDAGQFTLTDAQTMEPYDDGISPPKTGPIKTMTIVFNQPVHTEGPDDETYGVKITGVTWYELGEHFLTVEHEDGSVKEQFCMPSYNIAWYNMVTV